MHSKTRGVPKGSVLGPFFFLIYNIDAKNCVRCKITLFADDTIVYIRGRNKSHETTSKIERVRE